MLETAVWLVITTVVSLAVLKLQAGYRICPARCLALSRVLNDTNMLG
jgi:hypothetical protein